MLKRGPRRRRAGRGLPARKQAILILCRVLGNQQKLSSAFEQHLPPLPEARDRALCKALCFGVLSLLPRLEFIYRELQTAKGHGKEREIELGVRCAIYIGMYQLDHMRVPDHAAVSTSVEACRAAGLARGVSLANAVLRGYAREHEAMQQRVAKDEVAHYAHPQQLLTLLRESWPEDWQTLVTQNNQHPPLHLRVNPSCQTREQFLHSLREAGLEAESSPVVPSAVHLVNPHPIEQLPGYAEGWFAVQDVSSQLATTLLPVPSGGRMLDACAAPGGKTGLFLEYQPEMAQLVAVDRHPGRMKLLGESLARLGHLAEKTDRSRPRVEMLQGEASEPDSWWDGREFDAILLDAPCSGSGIIRHWPDIKTLRDWQQLALITAGQKALLAACWLLLKRGGRLLYATCSVLPGENANQIDGFLRGHEDCVLCPIDAEWGRDTGYGRQIITGEYGMDGFFYALLEKR